MSHGFVSALKRLQHVYSRLHMLSLWAFACPVPVLVHRCAHSLNEGIVSRMCIYVIADPCGATSKLDA